VLTNNVTMVQLDVFILQNFDYQWLKNYMVLKVPIFERYDQYMTDYLDILLQKKL
jgi:hypothetical protein